MEINELIPVEYSERVIELAKNIELFTSTVTIEPTYY